MAIAVAGKTAKSMWKERQGLAEVSAPLLYRDRFYIVKDGGIATLALMTGVLAWRTAAGALSVRESLETTMILGLPMWITYAVLAPGLALTAVIALVQMGLHWQSREEHPGVSAS